MQKSVLICSFLFAFVGLSSSSFAKSEIKTYNYGSWDFALDFNYFQAVANYSKSGGSYDNLPSGNDYQNYVFDFNMRNYISRRWAFYSGFEVAAAQSVTNQVNRNNSGLTHLLLGTDWVMYKGAFYLIPEISLLYPLVKNSISGDTVAINEGTMDASALMNAQFDFKKFRFTAFAGFTYRDEGRSSLLPYGAIAELYFKNWSIGGDFKGYASLGFDKDTDNDVNRLAYVNRANGGAYKYTMVNPSLMETNGWIKIKTSNRWAFKFGGGTTINGANSAAGWNIAAGLSFNLVPESDSPIPPETERFREETEDGVDQKLFVPEEHDTKIMPNKEDDAGSVEYYPPPPPPPPKKAQPKAEAKRKTIQQQLDATEMQIQLKSVKKKKKK